MPITKTEFDDGKLHSSLEKEITSFLTKRKERAFTSKEIMGGLNYPTEFSTPEIMKMSTFAISDFTALLYDLVKREEIRMRVVRNRMYFKALAELSARCPKCGLKIAKPKKTWKMAGRPNKKGEQTQLHIGLFECTEHGIFRTVLDKKKIFASASSEKTFKKMKKVPTKKHVPKRKTRKKKPAKKKKGRKRRARTWSLI